MERGQRRTPPQSRTGQPERPAQRPTQHPAQRPTQRPTQGSTQRQPQRRPVQQTRPAQPTRPVNRKRRKNTPKKPWIIGAAILLLLIIVLGSGGKDETPTVRSDALETAGESTFTVSAGPTAEPDVNLTELQAQQSNVLEAKEETTASVSNLFPQTIFDQKGLTITLTGFDKHAVLGPEIKFTVENNSGMDLIVQTGDLHCNGWQVAEFTSYIQLSNGSKAGETIYVYSSQLEECGLKVSDLVNVTFKNAEITTSDYMNSYKFEMNATLQ